MLHKDIGSDLITPDHSNKRIKYLNTHISLYHIIGHIILIKANSLYNLI